jgi:DNA-binding response OmpR family regulator
MRLLIVDDDETTRTMLHATLAPVADDIQEAVHGVEALQLARERRPDFVILDVMMPGVDGYEICYLMKTAPELPHTRVIILTSRGDAQGVATGRQAYADAYLLKPFDPDQLVAAIRSLQQGKPGPFPA